MCVCCVYILLCCVLVVGCACCVVCVCCTLCCVCVVLCCIHYIYVWMWLMWICLCACVFNWWQFMHVLCLKHSTLRWTKVCGLRTKEFQLVVYKNVHPIALSLSQTDTVHSCLVSGGESCWWISGVVNDNTFTLILSTRYRVSTLFLQPGPPCFPHNSPCTHGEYSDVVKCSVEGAMSCGYLPSVAHHWTVMLEESSKQPVLTV